MGRKSSYMSEYKTRLLSNYHVSNLSMAAFCDRMLSKTKGFLVLLSDNGAENCAKSLAGVRKNSLFAKSEKGGESADILMTLVTTAMANGVYPDLYVEKLLKNIRTDRSGLSKYMPWSPWMREGIEYKK